MRSVAEIFRSYAVFDADGKHVNGTDKQSNHNYGDVYESLFVVADHDHNMCPYTLGGYRSCDKCGSDTSHMRFCPDWKGRTIREEVKLVMEVGVADGSCLLAWSDVFPNATIVGMDIHPAILQHNRVEFHFGDQRSQSDCERAASGRHFDFICEDATHRLEDTLLTLLYLWPYVKPGGIYVVEEFADIGALQCHVAELWPFVSIIDTTGPFGGVEPLVVFRKPMIELVNNYAK